MYISVERIGEFCNPNSVQYFHCVIQSDLNPVMLSKYLIQSGLYQKNHLIQHFTAVINTSWISISDPVPSEISDLLLFLSYFASQSKRIKFGNYFF